jgi:hypothetical protein
MPFRSPWYRKNNNYNRVRQAILNLQAVPNNTARKQALANLVVNLATGKNTGAPVTVAAAPVLAGGNIGRFRLLNKPGPIGTAQVGNRMTTVYRGLNNKYYARLANNSNNFIQVRPVGGVPGLRKRFNRANNSTYKMQGNNGTTFVSAPGAAAVTTEATAVAGESAVRPGIVGKIGNRNVYLATNGGYFATKMNQPNTNFYKVAMQNNKFNYTNSQNVFNKVNIMGNIKFIPRGPIASPPPVPTVYGNIGQQNVGGTMRTVYRASNNRYFANRNGQPATNFFLLKKNGNNFNYNSNSQNVYNKINNRTFATQGSRPPGVPPALPPAANMRSAALTNWLTRQLTTQGGNYNKVAANFNAMKQAQSEDIANFANLTRNTNNARNTNAHRQFWNAVNRLSRALSETEMHPLPLAEGN